MALVDSTNVERSDVIFGQRTTALGTADASSLEVAWKTAISAAGINSYCGLRYIKALRKLGCAYGQNDTYRLRGNASKESRGAFLKVRSRNPRKPSEKWT
jgi:hypothetical protein